MMMKDEKNIVRIHDASESAGLLKSKLADQSVYDELGRKCPVSGEWKADMRKKRSVLAHIFIHRDCRIECCPYAFA
jgi:hypothetical protein